MILQEKDSFCVSSSSQKGRTLQPADLYGTDFSTAEDEALPTSFPITLVLLSFRQIWWGEQQLA